MRKIVALIAVGVLGACGGGGGGGSGEGDAPAVTDYSPAFVGTWEGSSVVVLDGQSVNSPGAYVRIVRTGTNTIVVKDLCGDGSGPGAAVNSESSFTAGAINCPAVPVEGCSAVSFAVSKGGTGSLSNGELRATFSGALTGCGYSYPISFTFTGTRTSTSSAALTVEENMGQTASRVIGNFAPGFDIRF